MDKPYSFYAPCPRGTAQLVCRELENLGADAPREKGAGASFTGSLEAAYRAVLWSRVASRVLLTLHTFPASSPEALYEGARSLAWEEVFDLGNTFCVDANVSGSAVTHSQYAALKVKDAVADRFREKTMHRPNVDTRNPGVRINLNLLRDQATLSVDLAGDSLFKRGYRVDGGLAPLKENLAAAILYLAGWPEAAAGGGALTDPMCGSATLLLEGAFMAGDRAPGLERELYGSPAWAGHDQALWDRLQAEARDRAKAGLEKLPPIAGADISGQAIAAAQKNIQAAGLFGKVRVRHQALGEGGPLVPLSPPGLLVVNPPYGERLGQTRELERLYWELRQVLKENYAGFRASVFTGNPELGKNLGLSAHKTHSLYNGPIACKLLHFELYPNKTGGESLPKPSDKPGTEKRGAPRRPLRLQPGRTPGPGAEMFANRLKKNLKTMGKWARKNKVNAYRLYDADMPEYNLAVDVFQGDQTRVHAVEYPRPESMDQAKADGRLLDALDAIPNVLDIPEENLFFKERLGGPEGVARGLSITREYFPVHEGPARFLVNFTDYLDTGLELNLRLVRKRLMALANGRKCLNLFAQNAVASVSMALGGASSCVSLEPSGRYLAWSRKNLQANNLREDNHPFVDQDVETWLYKAVENPEFRGQFGLVYLKAPVFFRGQDNHRPSRLPEDHLELAQKAAGLLTPDGVLVYVSNFHRPLFSPQSGPDIQIFNATPKTISKDFERRPRLHQCYEIRLA